MKDKTQYEALMEELQKIVENFRVGVTEIGERFAKLLPDIEIYEEEEEDTWEIKNGIYVSYIVLGNHLHTFSYFKNEKDAERAIDLFGDEIKELFVECD